MKTHKKKSEEEFLDESAENGKDENIEYLDDEFEDGQIEEDQTGS